MPRNHHEGAGEQVDQEQRGVHHVGGGVVQNVKHISGIFFSRKTQKIRPDKCISHSLNNSTTYMT